MAPNVTSTPDIALAASAREWPDRLHRHLLDHGGGRVTTRIMEPDQAIDSSFDVLFIDDICSFLTPRLVKAVKVKGAEVIGVFLPSDGSDAKRRLLECGISDVIETEATPEEYVEKATAAISHRVVVTEPKTAPKTGGLTVGITGAAQGVGVTELSVSLAALISRNRTVALVDADPTWPSVAQRLDLSPHPNIRTLLDDSLHGSNDVVASTQLAGGVTVVGGVADAAVASPLSGSDFSIVVDSLVRIADIVVADLGPLDRSIGGVLNRMSALALVGSADPVGLTRLMRSAELLTDAIEIHRLVLVVNKAPARPYYRAEVRAEVAKTLPGLPLVVLPFDRRLIESSWEGSIPDRGSFIRSVRAVARVITDAVDDD